VCGCIACERIYLPSEIVRLGTEAGTALCSALRGGWVVWLGLREFRVCPVVLRGRMSGGFGWVTS